MSDRIAMKELLTRTLDGDQEAGADLVNQLQPFIRRAVRIHLPLIDPLRRHFDSMDISQSVLVQFLKKAGTGAIEFRSPQELTSLLKLMAVQKFIDKKLGAEAECRDYRREIGDGTIPKLFRDELPPDEQVADRELGEEARRRMTDRERKMADLWAAGQQYTEIAAYLQAEGLSMTANAVRMALNRAFERVAAEMADE